MDGAAAPSLRGSRGRDGGVHPRVEILGLLEARLLTFDRVVLGALDETVWPLATDPGPWMSRPMRRDFGLPEPEARIGRVCADFLFAACSAPEAVLSRAAKRGGAPTVPARWLTRLETFLRGQVSEAYPKGLLLEGERGGRLGGGAGPPGPGHPLRAPGAAPAGRGAAAAAFGDGGRDPAGRPLRLLCPAGAAAEPGRPAGCGGRRLRLRQPGACDDGALRPPAGGGALAGAGCGAGDVRRGGRGGAGRGRGAAGAAGLLAAAPGADRRFRGAAGGARRGPATASPAA